MRKIAILSICSVLSFASLYAKEIINTSSSHRDVPPDNHVLASCKASSAQTELDINNVRTRIFINGDMWWDLVGTATYEIPKGSGKHSLFAGALWIGGLDHANHATLKVAAQIYRQSGSDFWPGPINNTTDVGPDVCTKFDRHWKITKDQVVQFVDEYTNHFSKGAFTDGYDPPEAIKTWPGTGDDPVNGAGPGYPHFLAPYYDNNKDGIYNYLDGDYPYYDLTSPNLDCTKDQLFGDQCLWWVFNDVGNVHNESHSANPIGIEVQAEAFAFATNDEINNMTFYKYKIINRNSSTTIDSCFFAQFVDADLGNYLDDYVGCDVKRGFGYCYNGDENDDGALGYGINPPAVGVDFFQGPKADTLDHEDNDRDSCIDCTKYNCNGNDVIIPDTSYIICSGDTIWGRELCIMSRFVYFNNNGDVQNGNPDKASDYYYYMQGKWRNNTWMTYDFVDGKDQSFPHCAFMFPDNTDPYGWGTNGVPQQAWSEDKSGNVPADRRFVQTAGPFTLLPGAVNYITDGAVWARASNGGRLASVKLVRQADDFAQALFNNCFKVVDGPDAPDVSIRELNNELILSFTYNSLSNNAKETYIDKDPLTTTVSYYKFEGYQLFQLVDHTVSNTEIHNADRARLIARCDIKNGVTQIINYHFDSELQAWVPLEEVGLNDADKGLKHTFRITTDLFAKGDATLINHKTYYYMAIAYAYNPDESVADPYSPNGRNIPYLAGRKNIKVYSAIPHIPNPENEGMALNTSYGDGPEITRIEGKGNGHVTGSDRGTLDLVQDGEYQKLFSAPYMIDHPTYQRGRGPVDIRVYDPIAISGGNFQLKVFPYQDTVSSTDGHDSIMDTLPGPKYVIVDTLWELKNLTTGQIDISAKTLKTPYDQIFPSYGFGVNMSQTTDPGVDIPNGAGLIEGTMSFNNKFQRWLTGVPDIDETIIDWIASGKATSDNKFTSGAQDGQQVFEKILDGTWTAYKFASYDPLKNGPAFSAQATNFNRETNLPSVDLVITNETSKWSKAAVIEEQYDATRSVGGAKFGFLRRDTSLIKDGNGNLIKDPANSIGYSYFPGYAVDVETGERLNIAFGEDSYISNQNGQDMRWNPTSNLADTDAYGKIYLGGRHVIYIFGHTKLTVGTDTFPAYDGCTKVHDFLALNSTPKARDAWSTCMWVGYPMLETGEAFDLANTVTIRLRVTKPYRQYQTSATPQNNNYPMYTFNTNNLAPTVKNNEVAVSALDMINVVPNPYYAYSQYEKNQLDNRIKIVNLPSKCTITIFTPGGTLVRKLKRDVSDDNSAGSVYPNTNLETSVDWDLKNTKGIPIASGLYIIHVEVPGVGEKTIKFFGVLRPIDLDTF